MRRWFLPVLVLLAGIVVLARPQVSQSQVPLNSTGFAGETSARPETPHDSIDAMLEGLEIDSFDHLGGRALFGAHQPFPPDISPEGFTQDLFERDAEGKVSLIASDVSFASYAPDGAVLYVQGDRLVEQFGAETWTIAQPVLGDFAIDPNGTRLVVARPGSDPESWLELIDRSGQHLAIVAEPDGANAWPVFASDGTIHFISNRTGVYSWFAFREGDEVAAQVTNIGLKPGPDVLGARFVPPPAVRIGIHFVDRTKVGYSDGEVMWQVDLKTGAARSADGRVR